MWTGRVMNLAHRAPECTGEWHKESALRWRCTKCHQAYHASPEMGMAARVENATGQLMKALAAGGRKQLDGAGPNW